MLGIIGFLTLCFLNSWFTLINIFNLGHGGGDLGPLLTGWVDWKTKIIGIILIIINLYLWYLLYVNSPIGIIVNA